MTTATMNVEEITFEVLPKSESLIDALIRDDPTLDARLSDATLNIEMIQRLLAISVGSFLFYGLAIGLCWQLMLPFLALKDVGIFAVSLASSFLLALAVCLPSFYFYTQLSGLDVSFRLVTAQALRIQARTGLLLLGALPPYVAVALGTHLGFVGVGFTVFGALLPYAVGLAGLATLHRSFQRLALVLPMPQHQRRHFVGSVVLAWAAVYTVVCPVAFVWIWLTLFGFLK